MGLVPESVDVNVGKTGLKAQIVRIRCTSVSGIVVPYYELTGVTSERVVYTMSIFMKFYSVDCTNPCYLSMLRA